MRKFSVTGIVMVAIAALSLVSGLATVSAQDTGTEPAPVITLERTACFGSCPVYKVSVFEDGTVVYNGENFVDVTGEQTSEITQESVHLIINTFADAGYFDWNEEYMTQEVTDLPYITTSITRDGETHQITRYAGDSSAPLALPYLEQWLDRFLNTQMWTGVQPNAAEISNGTDTPFITLERTQCFGACPVYTVAMYRDGTVVFTGVMSVKTPGVTIQQVEPASLTSIAERAKIFGYFDWQDSYETRVMTDQATVITSVQMDDQFKRITRYDGDPNAPVGLIWLEDIIDQSVTDLIQ